MVFLKPRAAKAVLQTVMQKQKEKNSYNLPPESFERSRLYKQIRSFIKSNSLFLPWLCSAAKPKPQLLLAA